VTATRAVKPWHVYLGVGLALFPIYYAFDGGSHTRSGILLLFNAGAVVAILYGLALNLPERRLPWLLFAAGLACSCVGNVLRLVLKPQLPPSWSDLFFLSAFPLAAAALLLLMFSASGRHKLASLADAGIVTFAFAVVQWTFVIGPPLRAGGSTGLRVVDALYPGMGVVLLAGLAGFFVSPAWRTPSFLFLGVGVATFFASTEVSVIPRTAGNLGLSNGLQLTAFVLLAVAALNPSMTELSRPRSLPTLRVSAGRIIVLAGALLVAPVTLITQQIRGRTLTPDVYEVLSLAAAISVLVVARFTGILRALERIRMRERTARSEAEGMQLQLVEQNERLLEADRLKDEFVALISHDLRTPLTSIIGYVELALDDDVEPPLDEERRSYLAVVSRSSERLLRLVDDLLFVARLQAGRLVLDPVELDIAEIASQAVHEAQPRAEQKRLRLSFSGSGPVPVQGDRGRMFQLLDNLVSNAIKFTPEGGAIEVSATRTADGALLEVSDTGVGLGPEEIDRVFERFFRSNRAVAGQIPGTGLGLFISKAIAEAHGGRISAKQRGGGGTIFRIELPTETEAPEAAPSGELVA
jgi:signal transduction histidine kinase